MTGSEQVHFILYFIIHFIFYDFNNIPFLVNWNADAINEANERENARVVAEATGSGSSHAEASGSGSSVAQQTGSRSRTRRLLNLFGRRR